MSHQRKGNHRKPSTSSSSSENNLWQNIDLPTRRTSQSSSGSSTTKSIYPNVPKRTQRTSSNNKHDSIQTDSRIYIPSQTQSKTTDEYSSIISAANQNSYTRHTLDLITKYTSPQGILQRCDRSLLSPNQSQVSILNTSESIHESKTKRALSPLDETNQSVHESKRTKSFDEDDDDDLSELIDHRRSRQNSSQNSNTTISSQNNNPISSSQPITGNEQRKSTVRKPTARKLSTNHQKPIVLTPPVPIEQPILSTTDELQEALIIEPDVDDIEGEITTDREEMNWLSKSSQNFNTQHNEHIEPEDHLNQLLSVPIIPSPTKLPTDTSINSLNRNSKQITSLSPIKIKTPNRSFLTSILKLPIDNSSPCSNADGRRFSSTSSNSIFFETPRSSLSRTTTSNMTSTPENVIKTDRETQIPLPSNIDMINQLIAETSLNANHNESKIDYNPIELSKKLFSFTSNNKYQMENSIIKKQFLRFGRYEIEILFPNDKIPTTYACDLCLKHFHGSSIASQRHASKCLYTQPPGKLVFEENNLGIFQIGKIKMTIEQRIYIKSLCRIARLFLDSSKSIDDTKSNQFIYYILCRRDPILIQSQSSSYRFVGYFSQQLNPQAQQIINNISCLFILPPYAQRQDNYQLLIAYSYFLIRSNSSTNIMYTSPARPLDHRTLLAFRTYCCDILFACIINHNHSSIKTITLDTLARQTFIHPRDILSSLYSKGLIASHPTDKSSIYLRNNAYQSMTSSNLFTRNKRLFMDMIVVSTDNEEIMMTDKQNIDKSNDTDIQEIVLD